MNKNTFIQKLSERNWEFLGKPDVTKMASTDPNENWELVARRNELCRSGCLSWITDEEIEAIPEDGFELWFENNLADKYYFKGDWKHKFKGSEFLIPVVEKELKQNERYFVSSKVFPKLFDLKEGKCTADDLINEVKKYLEIKEPVCAAGGG